MTARLLLLVVFVIASLAPGCSSDGADCPDGNCPAPASDGGPDPTECTPETSAVLCTASGVECGALSATDRCGNERELSCGSCPSGTCTAGVCVGSPPSCAQECAEGVISGCTCGSADPCGWSGDGYCDQACADQFPGDHFSDGSDCQGIAESLAASCDSNDDCAAELTCHGGLCVCCDDPGETNGIWSCNPTTTPAIALSVCGVSRAGNVADDYGPEALTNVGVGCYSGAPNNHWCAPQLDCVSRVEADEFRCGCCADILGSFMCSYDSRFARTFCLRLSDECADGSCLDCIGDECEPECGFNNNGVCDEPEGTALCPDGSDFTDCGP